MNSHRRICWWHVALLLIPMMCGGACGAATNDGTPSEPPKPAVEHRQLEVEAVQRRYRLYTPPDVGDGGRVPLMLALHGSGNSAESLVDASELDKAASAGGFIVAYPEALGLVWNGGFCCTSGRGSAATDVLFIERVVTDILSVRRIDEDRIYAVGFSSGGIMAYRLACDLAGRFAGIGALAASMDIDDCSPSQPISIVSIHGSADGVVPIGGGRIAGGATKIAPPASAVAERWAALDDCADSAKIETRGSVTTTAWSSCAGGTRVRLVTVDGGGHNWFLPVYGPPNGALNATLTLTEFFGLQH